MFSIIIPVWRGAVHYLPKLLNSIPENDDIEIIVVDNSREPLKKEEIDSNHSLLLLHSAPERHAGGSRNDGVAFAKGKWLLFADADDYFTQCAFDVFYSYCNSEADIIFFKPIGIYADTGKPSDRGLGYAEKVETYCKNQEDDHYLRYEFEVPWCKMIKKTLVDNFKIRFDEIEASNDMLFSVKCGLYANKIEAVNVETYVVTVNRGSLTKRRDYNIIRCRFEAKLRRNQFLKAHGLSKYQYSIMVHLKESLQYGFKTTIEYLLLILKYRQNPFIGWRNWRRSARELNRNEALDSKYIVK